MCTCFFVIDIFLCFSNIPFTADDTPLLRMMNKLRRCQQEGSPLYTKGAVDECKETYLKLVNEFLQSNYYRPHIPVKILPVMQKAKEFSAKSQVSARNATFLLRRAIDILYDHFMDNYCKDVDVYKPRVSIQQNRERIKEGMQLYSEEKYEESIQVNKKVAEDIFKFNIGIPEKNVNKLRESLINANSAPTAKEAASLMHDLAHRTYDESRLPEVYLDINGTTRGSFQKLNWNQKECREVILVNLKSLDYKNLWDIYVVGDRAFGGESSYSFLGPSVENCYGIFNGHVMNSNEGGLAILNMKPKATNDFKMKISESMMGFKLIIRNNSSNNTHFKMVLYTDTSYEAHWSADFILPCSEEFQDVCVPFPSFWPTIYGHSIGYPGQLKMQTIHGMAVALSASTDNGKVNKDYRNGEFSLSLQSVSLISTNKETQESIGQSHYLVGNIENGK